MFLQIFHPIHQCGIEIVFHSDDYLFFLFFSVNYFFQVGIYLPCYDGFRNLMENFTTGNAPMLTPYVPLVAGSVARSLACISCYPIELARTRMQVYLYIFLVSYPI